MKTVLTLLLAALTAVSWAQQTEIRGLLQNAEGSPLIFANVVLYSEADSALVKAETSDDAGVFRLRNIPAGQYRLVASYLGLPDLVRSNIQLVQGQQLELGALKFGSEAIELAAATVTAQRALIEVKPDRTVFNVQGTINSTGSDALTLLRKAPGVTVDNNNSVSVLGRAGVLLYVDGKRLPLTGDELTNFLQNLPADQIDRIDIISNPGARYEAEGNAGIIDIRLKKDQNTGANGSATLTHSQGRFGRSNISTAGNYRNKTLNTFGTLGAYSGRGLNYMDFYSYQNGLAIDEINRMWHKFEGGNYRLGTDFFLDSKNTLGFIVEGNLNQGTHWSNNSLTLAQEATPNNIDSILIAQNTDIGERNRYTFNVNYRFDNGQGKVLNMDADYGRYRNEGQRTQPNRYFAADGTTPLTAIINYFTLPTDIDIYTFKADYETKLLGGQLGFGTKYSQVISDNTFLVYEDVDGDRVLQNRQSNEFNYDERVLAGYVSYARPLSEKVNFSAGLRAEKTDATGDLTAYSPELQEPPVVLDYLSWFPSVGITWQTSPQNSVALNYGRRINRPDYNVLNPFNYQLSQLSYEKGNPFIRPEIVNNVELGYTLAYRYNFKLSYSKTADQITRLMAPAEDDPRANFITWENLAEQTVIGLNISAPVQVTKKWSAYFNFSASHIDNQADYGDGAVVDVQAFSYSIYQQQTFDLPKGFKGEISGWYSGPGVWGGVFLYRRSWSLDLGLQRKFFKEKLNARLSASDIFFKSGWGGESIFNGLVTTGGGVWDSRRVSLSLSYNFGNQNIKSRRRTTGLQDEAKRLGNEQ